jgi:hypothetical protein
MVSRRPKTPESSRSATHTAAGVPAATATSTTASDEPGSQKLDGLLLIAGGVVACLVVCGLGVLSILYLMKGLNARKKAAEIYRDGPGSTGITEMA